MFMIRIWGWFSAAFACFLMLGCAATQVPSNQSLQADPKNGFVAFSVLHEPAANFVLNAIVYLDGGVPKGGSHYSSNDSVAFSIARDSDYPDLMGHLFVVSLPAGVHQFTSWQIAHSNAIRVHANSPLPPLTFTVVPGEVKYLGAFRAKALLGKNVIGSTSIGGGVMTVEDGKERDLPILLQRYPQFRNGLKTELMQSGPWNPPGNPISRASSIPFFIVRELD